MAKTEFLQIRMTPESRQRLSRVAEADHLDESTWARRAILKAIERWEAGEKGGESEEEDGPVRKDHLRMVAEGKSQGKTGARGKKTRSAKTKRPIRRKRSE